MNIFHVTNPVSHPASNLLNTFLKEQLGHVFDIQQILNTQVFYKHPWFNVCKLFIYQTCNFKDSSQKINEEKEEDLNTEKEQFWQHLEKLYNTGKDQEELKVFLIERHSAFYLPSTLEILSSTNQTFNSLQQIRSLEESFWGFNCKRNGKFIWIETQKGFSFFSSQDNFHWLIQNTFSYNIKEKRSVEEKEDIYFMTFSGSETLKDKEKLFNEFKSLNINPTEQKQLYGFDSNLYFQNLETKYFGHHFLYKPVIESTQTFLFNNFSLTSLLPSGSVMTCQVQTKGRGRGQNSWVGNKECLQLTLLLNLNFSPSQLEAIYQKLVFVQYLVCISIIDSIQSLQKTENVRIKWPNDIYATLDQQNWKKIGGILVQTSFQSNILTLLIGIGLNVQKNEHREQPFLNLETVLGQKIEKEKLLASLMKQLEIDFDEFFINGFINLEQKYYQYWMHSKQKITISNNVEAHFITNNSQSSSNNESKEGLVLGLTKEGYLKVQTKEGIYECMPDGNSFDMTQNLITKKIQ